MIDTVDQPLIASPEAGRVHRRWLSLMEVKAETFEQMDAYATEDHETAEFGSYESGLSTGRSISYGACASTLREVIAEMKKFVEQ